MPYRYNVIINFKQDWISRLKKELESYGYIVKETGDDICFSYFNLRKRLIQPIPRKVMISNQFKCPKEFKKALNLLKDKIEKGENIYPYLSKRILNLSYHDDLLNDWGIYHLHLGTEIDKNTKFIKRTAPLLFARFDEGHAYFINIYKHGAWTKQKMIRILHENWPESIGQFRMKEIESVTPKLTDKQYAMLRKSHVTTIVEVEKGVVYFPIGMGYMSSGHSMEVIRLCEHYSNVLYDYEKHIKDNIVAIVKLIKDRGGNISNKLHFHLWLEKNKIFAYELYSNSKIELGTFFNE
ncbi:hypothetical protein [Clostridium sp. ATCC 25772]|uniref:hypothetical protein n=1 Tax=Clostridium sp. ATCC 25772 TaxID=1676991 RepID=UPI000A5691CC|nr:hypothetical protein [Clostridium sp. ATCC 25772]